MAEDDAPTPGGGADKKDTKKQIKNEHVLIIVGVITLLVTFVYMRKQAKNAQSTSASSAQSPYGYASNPDPYGYSGDINTLANDLQSMQQEIAGLQANAGNIASNTPGNPGGGVPTGPSNTPPTVPLPSVNAQDYPQIVPYGSYAPSDYTKIGTDVNGVYSGQQVSGGVPVYTNIFGGMAQGPFPKSGTYDIYIPSQFTQYEHA